MPIFYKHNCLLYANWEILMKKVAVFAFGIADSFCSKTSNRFLPNGDVMASKLTAFLSQNPQQRLRSIR